MRSKLISRYSFALTILLAIMVLTSATAFATSGAPADDSLSSTDIAAVAEVGDPAEGEALNLSPGGSLDSALMDLTRYNKNMDIWFMLILVAFLMCFIRKFEWGVCLATLLSAACSFITYMLIQQFFFNKSMEEVFTQDTMIWGVVCAITLVIAIGMFLGTIKMWQYILAGILFAPAFAAIEWILLTWLAGTPEAPGPFGAGYVDPGCGILVHLFAAYWGMGVILGIREKRAFKDPQHTTKHSVTFVWLAAMLLFMLWPSFVTSLADTADITSVMANCYMSGLGAIITAYLVSVICSKKVNALVYCYAFLAGPVASSSSLLDANPWQCLLIGAIAGALSTLAFVYLHGWLCNKIGALDIMGVHNLHGIGGWISLTCGAILVGSAVNFIGGVITLIFGLVIGCVTGLILKATRGEMKLIMTDDTDFDGHNPHPELEPASEDK